MLKRTLPIIVFGSAINILASASAAEFGTAEEAKVMLKHAITEVKNDEFSAIRSFNNNDLRFRDRDLFVFCFNGTDGKFTAHEAMVTWDVRSLRDRNGKSFGTEMYDKAQETG